MASTNNQQSETPLQLLPTMFVGKVHGVVVQINSFNSFPDVKALILAGSDSFKALNATYADMEVCISYCSSASAKAVCDDGDQ